MSIVSVNFKDLKYNLYEVLGLSKEASDNRIKKNFRKLVLELHPDKNKDSSEELYNHLIIANQVLSDSLNRKKYDEFLELEKISFYLTALSFVAAAISQLCLIYSFIISDYSIANVYQNSHHLKPLIYKISGSWGNHEGSMLLLISILSAYSFGFAFLSKIDAQRKIIISSAQSSIIALLAAFTAFTSNPFERIFPTPEVGLGLNPLLQDIGLALHPPMLYTGYIGFSLIFSFAIAGLLSERIDKKFAQHLKGWLFFSYGFLYE